MNKKAKDLLYIDCSWFAEEADAAGNQKDRWMGKVVLYDDNSIEGFVFDNNTTDPTYTLTGVYVENYGIFLYKFHMSNFSYDPITFSAFKNYQGKESTCYGSFSAVTLLGEEPLGYAKLKISQDAQIKQEDDEDEYIQDNVNYTNHIIENFKNRMKGNSPFHSRVFERISNINVEEITAKIKEIKNMTYYSDLPEVFFDDLAKTTSQPLDVNTDNECLPF
ncbi:MAG: hypothetical protein IJW36_03865 [Clostridia bacterium]|nr:hypothetical protein [Clostridia bacterium]